jgi:hypothetical protein
MQAELLPLRLSLLSCVAAIQSPEASALKLADKKKTAPRSRSKHQVAVRIRNTAATIHGKKIKHYYFCQREAIFEEFRYTHT